MNARKISSAIGKVRFPKRADAIAEELKRWIVTEALRPGDKLPQESELTETFGTSRWTIREALKSLEVQGLTKIMPGPGGGARVAEVSEDNATQLLANFFYFRPLTVRNLYDMRILIEPVLAEDVVGRLEPSHFAELEKTIAITRREAVSEDDLREQRAAELEFHNILASASGNPMLSFFCRFINSLLNDWVIYNRTYVDPAERFACENIEYHEQLLEAYRREDRACVCRVMREHVCSAADYTHRYNATISSRFLS